MAIKERRFKFRMIIFGFILLLISGGFLWYLYINQDMFGDNTAKYGTIAGLIFLGAVFYTYFSIKVKLRQHNLTKR